MKQVVYSRKEGDSVKKVVQGIVTEKIKGTGEGEGKVLSVKFKSDVYDTNAHENKEKVSKIVFWNSSGSQLASNAENILEVGKYFSALVFDNDGEYTAIAFSVKNVVWTFAEQPPSDEHPNGLSECNVIIGEITSGIMGKDEKHYMASMPIDVYEKDENDKIKKSTEWISISFWNKDDTTQPNAKLGSNASKCLTPYQPKNPDKPVIRRKAAIVCSQMNNYMTKNDEVRRSYNAYRFDRI